MGGSSPGKMNPVIERSDSGSTTTAMRPSYAPPPSHVSASGLTGVADVVGPKVSQ
jgi:hypothetical protein